MGFLEKIANRFLDELGNDIHKYAFVFPTGRAGLYFRRHLERLKKPGTALWAPRTYSINDFMASLSSVAVSDQLDLIFELYNIYREQVRQVKKYRKAFEDFYPWGKMIISDFDEIDKHLIDTDDLFRTLKEFKTIEDITKEEKADIYNRYTGYWEELGMLYREFNGVLRDKEKAYEGMIFREIAGNIEAIAAEIKNREGGTGWQKVVFCGFNALTNAETRMISHLLEEELAEIFWDMDRYFVEDEVQEAGQFFRRNVKTLRQADPLWVENRLAERKNITLLGVQSKVSQAKVLGVKLRELQESLEDPENVAVVLPDTSMLFPVLNSLPETIDKINITIGFPLQQTPVFSLFDAIMEMQFRVQESGGGGFYFKDLRQVLNHPYLKPILPDEITAFLEEVRENNKVYVKEKDIPLSSEVLKDLFKPRNDSKELMTFFMDLLEFIRYYYSQVNPDLISVDFEYIYHFYTLMSRLKDSLDAAGLVLEVRTFRQLFADIVQNSRIPFTGEPLEGLQIMGILETQTLDFTNLFVLSVNEGHLPPGKSQQSFIPYDVRSQVGLPTYKDRDAIAAYHFYRLLKNSENISLIYTTESRGVERSEKSRFIDQILIEYAEQNKNADITHRVFDFPFETQPIKKISIPKSEVMLKALEEKAYSPSSILSFLGCSLKFYFTYVLRLFEEEEIFESPDYRIVGDIMHNTLELLYAEYKESGVPIGYGEINTMKSRIDEELKKVFKEEMGTDDVRTGRNRVAFEVMRKLLENYFEKEREYVGVRVLMLEDKIEGISLPVSVGKKKYDVKLKGKVDRLDAWGEVFRVIDYKTGRIESLRLDSMDIFTTPDAVKRKEAFQLFFYRYLLDRKRQYRGKYRLGIYPFKKMFDELRFVEYKKTDLIDEEVMHEFEVVLKEIFHGLFDLNEPFTQTEDEDRCHHCPFVNICARDPGEDYMS